MHWIFILTFESYECRWLQKNQRSRSRKKKNLTLKERIDIEALDKCFVLNKIVLATVPGYSPWPVRIIDINVATITVEFFWHWWKVFLNFMNSDQLNGENVTKIHIPMHFESILYKSSTCKRNKSLRVQHTSIYNVLWYCSFHRLKIDICYIHIVMRMGIKTKVKQQTCTYIHKFV